MEYSKYNLDIILRLQTHVYIYICVCVFVGVCLEGVGIVLRYN